MRVIQESGLSIPRDLALIGVANMHYSDVLSVPLSTVDQDTMAMGRQAAQMLLSRMTTKKPPARRKILITPRLIIRDSSRRKRHPN